MLKINGVDMPTPSVFVPDINDLDDEEGSGRVASGDTVRDFIAEKRKLVCEWPVLTWPEISKLLKAVDPVFFEVTYPDPKTGTYETKEFYVGPRSAPAYHCDENGQVTWKGLKMNFIER